MSNLIDLRNHPKFRPKLDPNDPNYERDKYLRDWDAGKIPDLPMVEDEDLLDDYESSLTSPQETNIIDLLMRLEERPEKKPLKGTVPDGMAFCVDCTFKLDRRPWFYRWFFPTKIQATDLSCKALPRKVVYNPVTGKKSYLLEGCRDPATSQPEEAFPRCVNVNPIGACAQFRPRSTFR